MNDCFAIENNKILRNKTLDYKCVLCCICILVPQEKIYKMMLDSQKNGCHSYTAAERIFCVLLQSQGGQWTCSMMLVELWGSPGLGANDLDVLSFIWSLFLLLEKASYFSFLFFLCSFYASSIIELT